ncbi:MAG: ATP-binding protein [Gammaproteobacteria bacterium]|nr:ATP-binding protein [Gammaproteobacteria bacterium]HRX70776.1 ATP-binding protein [Candidatus Competibacteraceae bacterium]
MRFFNTAGPVDAIRHYTLPPLSRIDLDDVLMLIEQQKYFVLHAPRQTGKTSVLLALMERLNREGRYCCLYANIEAAQAYRGNVDAAMHTIVTQITAAAALYLQDDRLRAWAPTAWAEQGGSALNVLLSNWAQQNDKPIVLLLDEVDALVGDTLISLLRQIRAGYVQRPHAFPQTVVLCGVRDVRDYRIHTGGQAIITGGSAFNIKAESLRLGSFSAAEVTLLYQQHTEATSQKFAEGVLAQVWDLTQGQPWLVNALGYEACFKMKAGRDRTQPITVEQIVQAKENLILRRETHLDQLADKLREERVQRVIEPLLTGQDSALDLPLDDIDYVRDLGLVALDKPLRIANPIYREVIPRQLTASTEEMTVQESVWYLQPDHRLDMHKLLTAFQQFFREHAEHWVERFQYKEAGPQLLLQAFLQRIVNGGGRIDREYGLGRRRTDLLLQWPLDAQQGFLGPMQWVVLELKLLNKSLDATLQQGLEQTAAYLDQVGTTDGHLLIFDRRPGVSWEEKIFQRRESYGSHSIQVWGM